MAFWVRGNQPLKGVESYINLDAAWLVQFKGSEAGASFDDADGDFFIHPDDIEKARQFVGANAPAEYGPVEDTE